MKSWVVGVLLLVVLSRAPVPLAAETAGAPAIDWSNIEARNVVLFYTGQASWEWLLSPGEHRFGATGIRNGARCTECHAAEERDMGNLLVSADRFEAMPMQGKRGWLPLRVKTAHDGERLYVWMRWCMCGQQPTGELDPAYEVKISLMLDDGRVPSFTRAGCWAGCHEDTAGMATMPGEGGLTMYLPRTRTRMMRTGGGPNIRPQAELQDMLGRGAFTEYWAARLNKGAPPEPADGYVLERRHENPTALVTAEAERADGTWTVVLSRPLATGDPRHKALLPGRTYTVGFALHEAYASGRFHHVSFEHTLVLDEGTADLVAVRQ